MIFPPLTVLASRSDAGAAEATADTMYKVARIALTPGNEHIAPGLPGGLIAVGAISTSANVNLSHLRLRLKLYQGQAAGVGQESL